ncbi:unnamed protein product, partial [Staurois parvus]
MSHISAYQCPSMPPASVHQCHINATYQCPSELLSVPVSAIYQCQSVPPISAANQCHLSVPVSAAYQCASVSPISAHQCCLSMPPNSASHQCRLSVSITAASLVHISEGEKSLIYKPETKKKLLFFFNFQLFLVCL